MSVNSNIFNESNQGLKLLAQIKGELPSINVLNESLLSNKNNKT
jgi:hypothetical protein